MESSNMYHVFDPWVSMGWPGTPWMGQALNLNIHWYN